MAKVIERVQARYEVQEVEFGKVYKWHPAHIVLECQCGERLSLSASTTSCGECASDHMLAVKASRRYQRTSTRASKPSTPGDTPRIAKMAACLFEMRHQTFLALREGP